MINDPALTPEEHRLRDLMSEISERCWYAGWEGGTEYEVWRLATEGGRWGDSTALELARELEAIRTLAEELNRWIVWREPMQEGSDHEAMNLAAWRQRYEAWKTSRCRSEPT